MVLCVVVPFRTQQGKDRLRQLKTLAERLESTGAISKLIVVEQIDKHKFNRGLLLNIGVHHCSDDDLIALHDVDLLPNLPLIGEYSLVRQGQILHAGCLFMRYTTDTSEKPYFGGVHLVHRRDFMTIGGYPNRFYGWGGEDEEFRRRVNACPSVAIITPRSKESRLFDMEQLTLSQKLSQLRQRGDKCMNKWETAECYASMKFRDGIRIAELFTESVEVQYFPTESGMGLTIVSVRTKGRINAPTEEE